MSMSRPQLGKKQAEQLKGVSFKTVGSQFPCTKCSNLDRCLVGLRQALWVLLNGAKVHQTYKRSKPGSHHSKQSWHRRWPLHLDLPATYKEFDPDVTREEQKHL
eukprot:3907197-Amphidinium_carterae.2